MSVRFLSILILASALFGCNTSAPDSRPTNIADSIIYLNVASQNRVHDEDTTYLFDPTLKGGYTLVYKVDDELQHLYLYRGTIISEIASCSRRDLQKNLGYIGSDFHDHFALVHSYGSGNPHEIELIEKTTGEVICSGTWIDASAEDAVLIYTPSDSTEDTMILYEVNTGQSKQLELPDDMVTPLWRGVHIEKVTAGHITISYFTQSSVKTKMYSR
jgi:hypothetical protein